MHLDVPKQSLSNKVTLRKFSKVFLSSSNISLKGPRVSQQIKHIDMAGRNDKKKTGIGFAVPALIEWVVSNSSSWYSYMVQNAHTMQNIGSVLCFLVSQSNILVSV